MTSEVAIILAVVAILTFASLKTSFYLVKFFAGASYWLLGAYLVYNPLSATESAINNIALPIIFIGGFAFILMPFWYENKITGNGGRLRFKLPPALGGMSDEEEEAQAERSGRNYKERATAYRSRVNRRMGK